MKHNWEYKRLGDLCNISSSRRVLQSDWKESGVPFYRAREIVKLSENGFVNNELFISENLYDELAKSGIPQAGDIMLSAVGTLGATYIVKPTDKFYYKDASVICLSKISDLQPKFLCYLFDSNIILHQIDRQAKGATVGTITISNASKFKVPVPDYKVQEQIVAELDKINETIEDCRELLRILDALAQSLFYDTFGDPITNPKGWPLYKLSSISQLINGRAYKQNELLDEGKYKVIRVGNFFTNSDYYYSDLELSPEKYIDYGDLIFAWSASFGAFIWQGDKVIYHYHIWKILFDDNLLNKIFYKFLLNEMSSSFMKDLHGIGMMHLTKVGMENYMLPIPPLALQEKFAARIEQIEEQKKSVEQTIAELQTLLDSRMDYWFN